MRVFQLFSRYDYFAGRQSGGRAAVSVLRGGSSRFQRLLHGLLLSVELCKFTVDIILCIAIGCGRAFRVPWRCTIAIFASCFLFVLFYF